MLDECNPSYTNQDQTEFPETGPSLCVQARGPYSLLRPPLLPVFLEGAGH